MARYFFDIEDGGRTVDEEGLMLPDASAVPKAALTILLDVARFEAIANDDRALAVTVRNEAGAVVYRASVTLQAGWLADTATARDSVSAPYIDARDSLITGVAPAVYRAAYSSHEPAYTSLESAPGFFPIDSLGTS